MIKQAEIFQVNAVALIAAGLFAGFVVHFGELRAQEPNRERPAQAADSWIGKQVITKYGAAVRAEDKKVDPNRAFRV
jgi:hypothetical protein